jgi:predicted transcriptional regulator
LKAKKIRIGIRDVSDALDDFVAAGEALAREEVVNEETEIYFTSLDAFRKALTPKRLELLHLIKMTQPSSINHLAKLAHRNIKNVAEDVKYLSQVGLVETETVGRGSAPRVRYDEIDLRIAV